MSKDKKTTYELIIELQDAVTDLKIEILKPFIPVVEKLEKWISKKNWK